jgi:hypothetical protein
MGSQCSGQSLDEGGEDGPVRPVHAWSTSRAARMPEGMLRLVRLARELRLAGTKDCAETPDTPSRVGVLRSVGDANGRSKLV